MNQPVLYGLRYTVSCSARASHVDVDLSSLRSRTAVSLACSAPCPASVGRAAPPARSSRRRSRRAASASPCPSATARGRSPASCTRRSRRRCGTKSCHYVATTPGGNSALDAALREAKDVCPRAGRGFAEPDESTLEEGVHDVDREIKSAAPGLPAWSPTAVLPRLEPA